MPLCPRCRAEAEWLTPDLEIVGLSASNIGPDEQYKAEERLVSLVPAEDCWKLPRIGQGEPTVPDGVEAVECSRCKIRYDPNEEMLPMGELIERAREGDV